MIRFFPQKTISIFLILINIILDSCSTEQDYYRPVQVLNEQLGFIERKDLTRSQRQQLNESDINIEYQLRGDTSKSRILTSRIPRNTSLKSIVSEKKGNQLSIYISTSTDHSFLPNDSDIIASEVYFDLLNVDITTCKLSIRVNQYSWHSH